MKKNKLLRLASILLVLCLLTTSVISGTFAKYVTSDSGYDVARVAKFGVVATVSGDLFGETYSAVGGSSGNKIISYDEDGGTVSAVAASGGAASAKVVAPGTEGGTMTFTVKGTPEVSTTTTFGAPLDKAGAASRFEDTDIVLETGEYGVMKPVTVTLTDENKGNYWKYDSTNKKFVKNDATSGPVYELVNEANSSGYYPIVWTVGGTNYTKVSDAKTAITTALGTTTHKPNESVAANSSVTWSWPYHVGTDAISAADKQDTILGDLMAIDTSTQKLSDGSYVVIKVGSDYVALCIASETNAKTTDESIADQVVWFAYKETETSAPTAWDAEANVAVLTVSFGASLTVEQVD